jgi:hypothetical protein
LAAVFRDAGYLTAGITGGGYVSYHFGFAEGFDSYYSHQQSHSTEERCPADRFDGPVVLRRTKQWLRENGNRPFFLFVHTYDAHDRCPMSLPGKGRQRIDSSPEGRKRFLEYYDAMIAKADSRSDGANCGSSDTRGTTRHPRLLRSRHARSHLSSRCP